MAAVTHQDLAEITRQKRISESYALDHLRKSASIQKFDIFLSHSYLDAKEVLAIKELIEKYTNKVVYVDWINDVQLSREEVSPKTADLLRRRIASSKILIYAHSKNGTNSKWVPWELGYADAKIGKVAVFPIVEYSTDSIKGTEFMGLYPAIDLEGFKEQPGQKTLWVNLLDGTFKTLRSW